jgi:hypothetical protein
MSVEITPALLAEWRQKAEAIEDSQNPDPRLPDLVMLILRLSHALKTHNSNHDLPGKAEDYLRRKNLMPDVEQVILRNRGDQAR